MTQIRFGAVYGIQFPGPTKEEALAGGSYDELLQRAAEPQNALAETLKALAKKDAVAITTDLDGVTVNSTLRHYVYQRSSLIHGSTPGHGSPFSPILMVFTGEDKAEFEKFHAAQKTVADPETQLEEIIEKIMTPVAKQLDKLSDKKRDVIGGILWLMLIPPGLAANWVVEKIGTRREASFSKTWESFLKKIPTPYTGQLLGAKEVTEALAQGRFDVKTGNVSYP